MRHRQFEQLSDIWIELKKLSGIDIYAYGSTGLYSNHVTFVAMFLNKQLSDRRLNYELLKICEKFLDYKTACW